MTVELILLVLGIIAANTYFVYKNGYQAGYIDGVMESEEIHKEIKTMIDKINEQAKQDADTSNRL